MKSAAVIVLGGVGIALTVLALAITIAILVLKLCMKKPEKGSIAFFHPSAHGGGGGERVLWVALGAVAQQCPNAKVCRFESTPCLRHVSAHVTRSCDCHFLRCREESDSVGKVPGPIYVFTEHAVDAEALKQTILKQFGLSVPADITPVPLSNARLLAPEAWPRFTLLGQTLGAACVAFGAARILVPELWIDTCGHAATYPMLRLAGARVAAYVHYPTISSDMLSRVRRRDATYNNSTAISSSVTVSFLKLMYYIAFAGLYGWLGGFANVAMVNSSWTRGHVETIWWGAQRRRPPVVWPPCDVAKFSVLPLKRPLTQHCLVSVAQFRPEKNHELQLRALAEVKRRLQDRDAFAPALKLYLIGGCRHEADRMRAGTLRALAHSLGVSDDVEFMINAPFDDMARALGEAAVGLHTMTDEHFGIGVVEYMAAGCVPVAHDSAGPRMDIVVPALRAGEHFTAPDAGSNDVAVGCLAHDVASYAECIMTVLDMHEEERMAMAAAARRRALMFSQDRFRQDWQTAVAPVLPA